VRTSIIKYVFFLNLEPSEVESLKGIEENNKEDLSDIEAEARRLSLMIKFNHRGSLASLDKELLPSTKSQSDLRSASLQPPKVDLLKSTLELNYLHKKANVNKPILKKEENGASTTPQANRKSMTIQTSTMEETKSLGNSEEH